MVVKGLQKEGHIQEIRRTQPRDRKEPDRES